LYVVAVIYLINTINFNNKLLMEGNKSVIQGLFTSDEKILSKYTPGSNLLIALIEAFVFKFFALILSSSCKIPFGVFLPALTLGSLIGRIFGEI
jgi:H+/Cl- antiporter ClcA